MQLHKRKKGEGLEMREGKKIASKSAGEGVRSDAKDRLMIIIESIRGV